MKELDYNVLATMTEDEARAVIPLALGRIFRLASRPEQPDDVKQYEDARRVLLQAADVLGLRIQAPPCDATIRMRHSAIYGD